MNDPDAFDAFYKQTRARLLMQTLALTGDLTAARSAVRDAFVITWHHWRKVKQLEDAESWLRPVAWSRAQRRAKARVWHRNKFDPEMRSTLEALGRLSLRQRRLLLLDELSVLPITEMAREVGVTRQRAEAELSTARAQFYEHRGANEPPIGEVLLPLNELIADARWPRPSILRRAGTARRRTHTSVGALAVVAAVAMTGLVVNDGGTVRPTLGRKQVTPRPEVIQVADPPAPEPRIAASGLVTPDQVDRLAPNAVWGAAKTYDNTAADGLALPCQQARFADPAGLGALVREFNSTSGRAKGPRTSATQFTELSANQVAAQETYDTTLRWYAGCTTPRVQLLSTERITGVGDQAMMFTLQSWAKPMKTYSVGIARTGLITTTIVATTVGSAGNLRKPLTSLTAAAVNHLCGTPGAGTCAAPPTRRVTPPIEVGQTPGMIDVVDMPPVNRVSLPWVGTGADLATVNVAASRCDKTSFSKGPVRAHLTRTFVIPGASLPAKFGLTQTVGLIGGRGKAAAFVAAVRTKMSTCQENDLGTSVSKITHADTDVSELDVWEVRTEISDETDIRFLVAMMRHGNRVAQIGFIPDGNADMPPGAFEALARRALARLPALPDKLTPEPKG
ncbi:MAG: hypothetical protein ACRCYU_20735 [Nocardioides sp.]